MILTVIPVSLVLIGGIAFLLFSASGKDAQCKAALQKLEEMETMDISVVEAQMTALKEQEKEARQELTKEGIRNSETLLSDIELKQAFSGSIIVGDSITEAISGYGLLGTDVVIGKKGLRIDSADEQIQTAINLCPSHLFLAFGTNDMEVYNGNAAGFIDAYRVQIEKIKAALPDTPVYINSILPVQDFVLASNPSLGYSGKFNEALQALCEETGCTFIDSTFLVEGNDSMYEPDGEHVVLDYYPKWLTYMAEMAGL